MRPRSIATVDQVQVVDDALEKRVELHLHTTMSDMDGMSSAASLIKQAHKWGQKAVAITDHGVAQAFPEAMSTALDIQKEDPDFKILYGTEAYFVNDLVPAVTGESQHPLTGDFICFDLETTGLSPQNDRITEIGAVRIHNGEITDRFDTFVDPERPIPEKITQLTSITDEMVKGAPKEAQALEQFFPVLRGGRGAGGPQRRVRRGLCPGGPPAPGQALREHLHRHRHHGPLPPAGPEQGHPGFRGQLLKAQALPPPPGRGRRLRFRRNLPEPPGAPPDRPRRGSGWTRSTAPWPAATPKSSGPTT